MGDTYQVIHLGDEQFLQWWSSEKQKYFTQKLTKEQNDKFNKLCFENSLKEDKLLMSFIK